MGHYGSEIDPDWGLSAEERRERSWARFQVERESERQAVERVKAVAPEAVSELEQEIAPKDGVITVDVAGWLDAHGVGYGPSRTAVWVALEELRSEGVLATGTVSGIRAGYRLAAGSEAACTEGQAV